MQVFVAGATGVLGRRVVARLLGRGHKVVGLARSESNEVRIRALGAEPRRADIFHPKEVEEAITGTEAVLHLATAIPTAARTSREDWVPNDRLRREGTRNLVDAALRKARGRLGFAPRYPTYREGYRAVLEKWRESLSIGT